MLLIQNNSGSDNSAFGFASLPNNTSGHDNSAFGEYSLQSCHGSYNTAIGSFAGNNITSGEGNIAIGFNAQVPNSSGSNQVRIGNMSITNASVQVGWTVPSGRRWKADIQESNLGLDFISKLKPVSYYRTNDESKKREYGFIAQELEEP